jgi:hypothetical protein
MPRPTTAPASPPTRKLPEISRRKRNDWCAR